MERTKGSLASTELKGVKNANRRGPVLSKATGYWFLVPLFLYLVVFAATPLVDMALMSFREVSIGNLITGDQSWIGLDNYKAALSDERFSQSFSVTMIFATASVAIQIPAALFFAVILNARVWGHQVGMAILLLGWLFPPITVAAIARLVSSSDVGILNTILIKLNLIPTPVSWLADPKLVLITIIFLHSWSYIPFATLLLYGGLKAFPNEIYEAASVDGAGRLRTFFSITMPLLRPVTLIVGLLMVIMSFRVFDLIYVVTGGGPNGRTTTLPFHAYRESFVRNNFGVASAISVLTLLILLIAVGLYMHLNRKRVD